MHVLERFIQRDAVAPDGLDVAPFGLARIEVRGGKDDLVAGAPLAGVQHVDSGAAGLGSLAQLGPGVAPVTVQVQGAARHHDAAVSHAVDVFIGHIVGQGDGRVARMRLAFRADLQFATHEDPLGGELEILVVTEAEHAVNVNAVQGRRIDVKNDIHALADGDDITRFWHRPTGPDGGVGPLPPFDRGGTLAQCSCAERETGGEN